jgi:hypothetical protein
MLVWFPRVKVYVCAGIGERLECLCLVLAYLHTSFPLYRIERTIKSADNSANLKLLLVIFPTVLNFYSKPAAFIIIHPLVEIKI